VIAPNAAAFSQKRGQQEKDPRDVSGAGTSSRVEPTVPAGLLYTHQGTELLKGSHDHFSVSGISGIGRPNSLATFLGTSMTM
jgi:hypothetical protein